MILKKCVNGTEQDCTKWGDEDLMSILEKEEALEEVVWNGLKMWHLIFLSIAGVMCVVILFCCCVKFRIPRTKQEIEADYIRRQILRKFRKRLKAIQNQELDEMDLKKALDKIRAEFKSDSESLAQSEAGFSAATISSNVPPRQKGSTYRRASQIQIDISLDDLRAHTLGPRARLVLALSRLCGRSKGSKSDKVALTVDAEGEAHLTVPDGAFGKKGPPAAGDLEEGKQTKKTKKSETPAGKKETKTDPAAGGKGPENKKDAKSGPTTTKKGKDKENAEKKKGKDDADKKKEISVPEKTKDKDKEKVDKKKKKEEEKETKSKPKDSLKPSAAGAISGNKESMEVKGQEAAGTSGGGQSQEPSKSKDSKKKEEEDKKAKEKEEKERKKAEKEKERLDKEKAKAEKTKLKIENEKAQKAQKEKAKEDKKKKEKVDKENKPEEKAKK